MTQGVRAAVLVCETYKTYMLYLRNLVFLFFSLLAQKDEEIGRGTGLPLKILLTSIVEYGN